MKIKYRLTCIIILFNLQYVVPQNWYPTQLGDKYQFEVYHFYASAYSSSEWYEYKKYIVDDFRIFDNKVFYRFYGNFYYYDYINQKLLMLFNNPNLESSYEILTAVDFNLPAGITDSLIFAGRKALWTSNGTSVDTIFGSVYLSYSMDTHWYDPKQYSVYDYSVKFADNIGLYYDYNSVIDLTPVFTVQKMIPRLLYAVIGQDTINPTKLQILSVSDTLDRAKIEFPYSLYVTLNMPFGLLDSLYTDYYIIRYDTLLVDALRFYATEGELNRGKIYINIHENDIEIGDIIKFKVYAKDKSIFETNDTLPKNYLFTYKIISEPLNVNYDQSLTQSFFLAQNYPNPFNPTTKIQFIIPNSLLSFGEGFGVKLIVYDILGNEIATLVNEEKAAGTYEVEFDGAELPSGIYFYQLKAGSFVETKKMVLMK